MAPSCSVQKWQKRPTTSQPEALSSFFHGRAALVGSQVPQLTCIWMSRSKWVGPIGNLTTGWLHGIFFSTEQRRGGGQLKNHPLLSSLRINIIDSHIVITSDSALWHCLVKFSFEVISSSRTVLRPGNDHPSYYWPFIIFLITYISTYC